MFRTVLFTLITALASAPVFAVENTGPQDWIEGHSLYFSAAKQHGKEIVFIDRQVSDRETLLTNLRGDVEVIVLDAEQDSISQISSTLQQQKNVSALHIISHGRDGEILFANGNLNTASIQNYSAQLASWSNAFTENADILFYGCNVAEGEKGRTFLRELSAITGTDVAASKNLTGSAHRDGDWLLEHRLGDVETRIALTERGISQYQNILAATDKTPPSFSSAHIGGDGSTLVIVYDEPLDVAFVPDPGAYTVTSTILASDVAVNGVLINEFNSVTLSLISTIAMTDTITVSYDDTFTGNHVQDLAGNLAAGITPPEAANVGTLFLSSSEWTAISPSGGSQFDYFVDQQTGQADGDIVGDGDSNPGFQVKFDDNGNASNIDGFLSFRFRIAEGGSNYYMVGIDADLDGAIDVYIRSDTTNSPDVEIVANGGGLNISPNTSDLGVVLATGFTPVTNTMAATDIDGNTVGILSDLDGAGNPDFYVNASVPFGDLVIALAAVGVAGVVDTDPLRYAVATSVNGSTFNQDIAGLPKTYDVNATFVSTGAFSDPVLLDGSIAPVQSGTPVINDLSGDTLIYVQGDLAQIIDQSTAATITDDAALDANALLDGGLHVEIKTGVVTEDLLGIDTTSVTLSTGHSVGSTVTVGSTIIGTITDIGLGSDVITDPEISFTVTFDQTSGATLANVATLIQSVTYTNATAPLTEGVRTVSFLVSDGALNTEVFTSVSVTQTADLTAPVITLLGSTPVSVSFGSVYTDAGATALDNIDGDITGNITLVSTVNTAAVGSYSVTYNVSDASGNVATPVVRVVNVVDASAPVITVTAGTDTVEQGGTWTDAGATTTDNVDADGVATTTDTVDTSAVGATIITYTATDAAGNTATATRTVTVTADTLAPSVVITSPPAANSANQFTYPVSGNCTVGDGNVNVEITAVPFLPVTNSVSCSALGVWSTSFDVSGISDGTNILNISASQTDSAGNQGNAVGMQADKDVLITVPTIDLLITNIVTPTVTGTADANTIITIAIGGASYTTTATAGGLWSLDTAIAIPDSGIFALVAGANNVVVTSVDAAGNTSADVSNNEVTLNFDDDNDGIPNSVECPSGPPFDNTCTDSDGDGIPDFQEVDSDKDGIPDSVEAGPDAGNPIDSDGDGTPDYQDTDSDNDGTSDFFEGSTNDNDNDGIPDYVDVGATDDSDGDGISDSIECPDYKDLLGLGCPDTDSDGQPDYLDTDSDGDGIDDAVEAGIDPTMPIDTDGDGIDDYMDTDSDKDGTDDSAECPVYPTNCPDVDVDGILDYVDFDTAGPGAGDGDGDGIADNIECELYPLCADSDSDGTPDYMEADSDADGIPDLIEAGSTYNDTDNDGIDNAFDVDITGGLDLKGGGVDGNEPDGIDDTHPLDTDGDGTPDYQDTDSDGDGFADDDITEGVIDTDVDGIPNYLDVDSGNMAATLDGSGDSDGDGISDKLECPAGIQCPDVDQDGVPDYMDAMPNDGPAADNDNDGLLNYLDPDDDNDNIPDVVEDPNFDADNNPATNPLDSDLDGLPDHLDTDSDSDGFSDAVESGASGNDSDGDNIDDSYDIDLTGGNDVNGDGVDDDVTPLDSDGDSLPDYLDTVFDGGSSVDTDNDGIPDNVECPTFPTNCPDTDGDGSPDFLETDSDGDGIDDSEEKGSLDSGVLLDTDGDSIPDYQDLDSDGDGLPDAVEGLDADSDADGIPDALDADSSGAPFGGDSDGDGVADMDECNSYPVCADSNNDGTPDYMDASSKPFDPNANVNTALNGVGGNGPWSLLLIPTALMLRRKIVHKNTQVVRK